uniref:Uncharacterized protein n=1 Tax=Tetranychus urticae TaxID=32264 RepID=T1KMU5_TETUR
MDYLMAAHKLITDTRNCDAPGRLKIYLDPEGTFNLKKQVCQWMKDVFKLQPCQVDHLYLIRLQGNQTNLQLEMKVKLGQVRLKALIYQHLSG